VDLAIGEIPTVFTQLDEHLEAVAARFLLFRRELVASGHVFFALGSLAAALGQRLELGDHLAVAVVVIDEIIGIGVCILCGAARAPAGRLARAWLGRGFCHVAVVSRFAGDRLLGRSLLGRSLLGRSLLGCRL